MSLARRLLLSIDTQNKRYCIRITDTAPIGEVVTPDCFVEIADGSSLYWPEGLSLRL
jgi:hypothetical protein